MSGTGGGSGGGAGGGTPQVDILALGVETGPLKQAEAEVARSLTKIEGAAESAAQSFEEFEKSVYDAATAAKDAAGAAKTLDAATTGAAGAAKGATGAQTGLSAASRDGAVASKTQAQALKALEAELAEARRAMIAMGATIADMNKAMDAMQKQAAGAGKAQAGVAGAAQAAAGAYGLTTREIQQLLPQINDVFTQLSMGQSLLMTATAQGPQIIQQLGGFGATLNALGRFAASFMATATGMGVAIGAIGLAAVAMSESTDRSLATLSQRLRMTREDYEALSVAVTETAKRVAASSSMGTGDARDAGRIIASQSRFSGSEAELENLVRLSGRLARAMGVDVPAAADVLAKAIEKPTDAARRMASEGLRTMDEGLVRTITRLENQGRILEAQQAVIGAYQRALEDASKTPLQQAMENLGNSFQRLMQAIRPIIDAIGSALARALAFAVDMVARLVDGLARLIEFLSDNRVTQFLGLAPQQPQPATGSGGAGSNATQEALRRVRELNPRLYQRENVQDQIGALRRGLAGASPEQQRAINAGIGSLQEQLRGLQGPMEQYLKSLREQNEVAQASDGYTRAMAQAFIAVRNAGGGTEAQIQALTLTQQRLNSEWLNGDETIRKQIVALQAQAVAQAGGTRAATDASLAQKAYQEATEKFLEGSPEFEAAVRRRTELLLQERDARDELRNAQTVTNQEQQLELLRAEIDLVGQSVVQREKEVAALRERQRILNEGGDVNSDSSQARIANAERIAEATMALQRQQSAFTELQRIGEQAFDRIGSAITAAFATGNMKALNFRNIAKAVFSEVLQWMMRLAVINPLKNAFGGNNPTLFDVGSVLGMGAIRGASVANTGGAAVAGAEGGGGLAGAATSFGTLRTAWNGITSPGGLGSFFPGGAGFNTGFSAVDGILNTSLIAPTGIEAATNAALGSMGGAFGPATPASVISAGASPGLTIGSALGPLAAIGGGAFGIYSGLQKGGIGGALGAAGGAVSTVTGLGMLGAAAGLLPALGALGPIGLGAGAILAIAGSLMPGAKPSSMGQSARTNLTSGERTTRGLGGDRYSAANAGAAGSTLDNIVQLSREIGDRLGGARIGGDVQVGVTRGDIYLNVNGQSTRAANSEQGSKDIAAAAGRMILNEFGAQGVLSKDYQGIVNASGGSLEKLDENLRFYEEVWKSFEKTATVGDKVAQATKEVVDRFNPLIDKAHELGLSSDRLVEARAREREAAKQAVEEAERARVAEIASLKASLDARRAATKGADEYEAIALVGQTQRAQAWAEELRALEERLKALGVETADAAKEVDKLRAVQDAEYWKQRSDMMGGLDYQNQTRILRANGMDGSAEWMDFERGAKLQIEELRKSLAAMGVEAWIAAQKIAETEQAINAERQARIKANQEQLVALDQSLNSRILRASGRSDDADLADFEAAAAREIEATRRNLINLGATAATTFDTIFKTEQAIGLERIALQKQIAERIAAEQKAAAEEAARAWDQFVNAGGGIRSYIDSLKTQTGPGGVSTAEALTEAQKQFGADLTLARGGDMDALSRITSSADRVLKVAQEQYASGADFQAIRRLVISSLESLPATRSYDAMILEELQKLGGGIDVTVDLEVIRVITEALNALPAEEAAKLVQTQIVMRTVEEKLGRVLTSAERASLATAGTILRTIEQAMGRNLTSAERDSLIASGVALRSVEQAMGRNLTTAEREGLVASGAVLRLVEQAMGRNLSAAERDGLVTAANVQRTVEQVLGRTLTPAELAMLVEPGFIQRTVRQDIISKETIEISRSMDDKLSSILNAQLVIGRETLVAMTAIGTEANNHTRQIMSDINNLWRAAVGASWPGILVRSNWSDNRQIVGFARGGVFDGPVLFPMAGGRTGMLGEAGPEAIVPLERMSDGKLGVRTNGGMEGLIAEVRELRREVAYLRAERAADAKRAQQSRDRTAKAAETTAEATSATARERGTLGRRRSAV